MVFIMNKNNLCFKKQYCFIPLEERIVLDGAVAHDAAVAAQAAPSPAAGPHVLIVPNNIPDSAALINAAKAGVVVVSYDPAHESLSQLSQDISKALGGQKASSIGFVGAGDQGGFSLGDGNQVDLASLTNADGVMANFWRQVASQVQSNGQIDIIACDVSKGDAGQAFIQELTHIVNDAGTNIDINASSSLIGNSPLIGSNWVLHDAAGTAFDTTNVYFEANTVASWDHVLGHSISLESIDLFAYKPVNDGSGGTYPNVDITNVLPGDFVEITYVLNNDGDHTEHDVGLSFNFDNTTITFISGTSDRGDTYGALNVQGGNLLVLPITDSSWEPGKHHQVTLVFQLNTPQAQGITYSPWGAFPYDTTTVSFTDSDGNPQNFVYNAYPSFSVTVPTFTFTNSPTLTLNPGGSGDLTFTFSTPLLQRVWDIGEVVLANNNLAGLGYGQGYSLGDVLIQPAQTSGSVSLHINYGAGTISPQVLQVNITTDGTQFTPVETASGQLTLAPSLTISTDYTPNNNGLAITGHTPAIGDLEPGDQYYFTVEGSNVSNNPLELDSLSLAISSFENINPSLALNDRQILSINGVETSYLTVLTYTNGVLTLNFHAGNQGDAPPILNPGDTYSIQLAFQVNPGATGNSVLTPVINYFQDTSSEAVSSSLTVPYNDPYPSVTVSNPVLLLTQSGSTVLQFDVSLGSSLANLDSSHNNTTASGQGLVVNWSTNSLGTAVSGIDFTSASGSVTFFSDGPTTQQISVQVAFDANNVGTPLTVGLNLNAEVLTVPATATGTLINAVDHDLTVTQQTPTNFTNVGSTLFFPGEGVSLNFTATNNGVDEASAITITNILDTTHMSFAGVIVDGVALQSNQYTYSNGTLTFNLPNLSGATLNGSTLTPGESVTFNIQANLIAAGFVDNQASFTYTDAVTSVNIPAADTNQVTFTVGQPIFLQVPDQVAVQYGQSGDPTTMTFTVSIAQATAEDIIIDWSTAGNQNGYTNASGQVTILAGQTTASTAIVIQLNYDAQNVADQKNFTLNLSSDHSSDIFVPDASATGTILTPAFTVVETAAIAGSGAAPMVGDYITYTVIVTNTGNVDLSSLQLLDTRDPNLSFAGVISSSGGTAVAGSASDPYFVKILSTTLSTGATFTASYNLQVNPTVANGVVVSDAISSLTADIMFNSTQVGQVQGASNTVSYTTSTPFPTFTITPVSATSSAAGQTTEIFTITASNPYFAPITFNYSTSDGSALSGVDYLAASGQITVNPFVSGQFIPQGEPGATPITSQFSITILPAVLKPLGATVDYNVQLSYTDADSNSTVSLSSTGTIITPAIANFASSQAVSDMTQANQYSFMDILQYSITLNNLSNVVVNTVNLDSFLPTGLTYVPGTLTLIKPDGTVVQFTDAVDGDAGQIVNGNHVSILLGDLALDSTTQLGDSYTIQFQAMLNTAARNGTIITNDSSFTSASNGPSSTNTAIVTPFTPLPTIIAATPTTVKETNPIIFTFQVSNPYYDPVTFNYNTVDGTARSGINYVAASGTMTFQPGITTNSIQVQTLQSGAFAKTQQFSLALSDPSNSHGFDSSGDQTASVIATIEINQHSAPPNNPVTPIVPVNPATPDNPISPFDPDNPFNTYTALDLGYFWGEDQLAFFGYGLNNNVFFDRHLTLGQEIYAFDQLLEHDRDAFNSGVEMIPHGFHEIGGDRVQGSIDLFLDTPPTSKVTIIIEALNQSDSVQPSVIEFTSENWDQLQKITIIEQGSDQPHKFILRAQSEDDNYNGMTVPFSSDRNGHIQAPAKIIPLEQPIHEPVGEAKVSTFNNLSMAGSLEVAFEGEVVNF